MIHNPYSTISASVGQKTRLFSIDGKAVQRGDEVGHELDLIRLDTSF